MRNIVLTQGYYAIVDDDDYEWLSKWNWCAHKEGNKVYACRTINSHPCRTVHMHSQITGYPFTDHVNGDGLDNRRSNLREGTYKHNRRNSSMQSRNTSGFKGVYRYANRWKASIGNNGNTIHIGCYDTPEEAARAYDKKAVELFGEFARPNFR